MKGYFKNPQAAAEAIKVFVVLKGGERVTKEEIVEHCRQHLMKLKVPSFIGFVEDLPKTSVGKVQKHILKRVELEKISHARQDGKSI
jgi:acyl-coenzyme A synthetase/AMP-(fatty) acid ligase